MNAVVAAALVASIAILPVINRIARVANGYGIDLLCIDDIDSRANDTTEGSIDSLRQDCYHRLCTAHGQLPGSGNNEAELNYGFDIMGLLHRPTTEASLRNMAGEVKAELEKDDRILSVSCTVTYAYATKTLQVSATITPQDTSLGDFDLIVNVTTAGTTLAT